MARKDKTVAVAERDPSTEVEDDEQDGEESGDKAQRARAELETMDPNERVAITISVPAGLKLALTQEAEKQSVSASAYSRDKLADFVGYAIAPAFYQRTRSSRYASPEEAKQAAAARAKTQREQVKKILALMAEGKIAVPEGVNL